MNSEEGKIFIGGIPRDTTERTMFEYFSKYGHITMVEIPRNDISGRPRGFGFVSYSDPTAIVRILHEQQHIIGNKLVEVKRAWSREQYSASRTGNPNSRTPEGREDYKIYVGGLPPTLDEDGLIQYFEKFGHVTNVVLVYDQTNQRRGFGFIYFDTESAVKRALQKKMHDLNGNLVHVKRTLPKHANPGNGGGGYQPYGASSVNAGGAYDNRALSRDANPGGASGVNAGGAFDSRVTYMQPQTPAVRYPYSGHSAPDYRYGNAGVGPYGNPNASNTWYATRPHQSPSYGVAARPASILGQSPSGASLYSRNQAYGYGNLGGRGFYPAGGRSESSGEQHMGSRYRESNGNYGYPGGSWRSDPPQFAQPRPNQRR